MAHEEGFGPVDLSEINIIGDVPLGLAQERASAFRVGLVRVEDYFEGTSIRAYSGKPPGGEVDYCWGGCPGALEEAIEILRLYDAQCDDKIPPMHIVFGAYEGTLDVRDGEQVVFLGDCASFKGNIHGKPFELESVYVDRSEKSPYEATAEGIFTKMAKVTTKMATQGSKSAFRIAGCPVSVAEQVLLLVNMGKLNNPYLDKNQVIDFNNAYFSSRTRKTINRIFGQPYQRSGPTPRGASRPKQNLPPKGVKAPLEKR